jgi:hypothetical protein
VARLFASSVRREALRLNRDGRYDDARTAMLACAERIAGYAGNDPELHKTVSGMRDGAQRYREEMSVHARKLAYSSSVYSMKMRSDRGASMRSGDTGELVLQPLLPETHDLVKQVVRRASRELRGLFTNVRVSSRLLGICEERERAGGELSPAQEHDLVRAAAQTTRGPQVRIVITCRRLEDNWFSHWHAPQRTAVSSLFAWDQTAAIAAEAFVAYEILLHGLHALSPRYDMHAMVHQETRGCLFDFCGLRADIEIKLQTMDVCGECGTRLEQLGIRPRVISELCEVVRELARPVAGQARRAL